MHRFYCPQEKFSLPATVLTDKEEIHHARNVLRLKKNDAVELFNGIDQEASGTIESLSDKEMRVNIHDVRQSQDPKPEIILACAIPKKGKFEYIVEKATELQVHAIIPLKTQRSEVNFSAERSLKKIERYQSVALNAAKQSQRVTIPKIEAVAEFKTAVEALTKNALVCIPSLQERHQTLLNVFQQHPAVRQIAFLIGPEGDFTPQEYSFAQEKGCIPVTLGHNVLKVETAALIVCSFAHLFYHR